MLKIELEYKWVSGVLKSKIKLPDTYPKKPPLQVTGGILVQDKTASSVVEGVAFHGGELATPQRPGRLSHRIPTFATLLQP